MEHALISRVCGMVHDALHQREENFFFPHSFTGNPLTQKELISKLLIFGQKKNAMKYVRTWNRKILLSLF